MLLMVAAVVLGMYTWFLHSCAARTLERDGACNRRRLPLTIMLARSQIKHYYRPI